MRSLCLYILTATSFLFTTLSCTTQEESNNVIRTMRDLQQTGDLVVRFARLEIDSTQLDEYMLFLKEGIEQAVELEAGVLTMYAVQEEGNPSRITVLEIYANDSAYQSHLNTPHFQKYKTGTLEMVNSLELIDVNPIVFGVDIE